MMITPKHIKKSIKGDYRLIVISDIHGLRSIQSTSTKSQIHTR